MVSSRLEEQSRKEIPAFFRCVLVKCWSDCVSTPPVHLKVACHVCMLMPSLAPCRGVSQGDIGEELLRALLVVPKGAAALPSHWRPAGIASAELSDVCADVCAEHAEVSARGFRMRGYSQRC